MERDQAGKDLALVLTRQQDEIRAVTQLIIAHSHGGNVAIRALSHLSGDCDCSRIFIATLATPFVEVVRSISYSALLKKMSKTSLPASGMLIALAIFILMDEAFQSGSLPFAYFDQWEGAAMVFFFAVMGLIYRFQQPRDPSPENLRSPLVSASTLNALHKVGNRFLVIRAIDDEATLFLATGSTGNLLSKFLIITAMWMILLLGALTISVYPVAFVLFLISGESNYYGVGEIISSYPRIQSAGLMFLNIIWWATILLWVLYLAGMICKSTFGNELFLRWLMYDVNTHSVPDIESRARVITLKDIGQEGGSRHGLYKNAQSALVIGDWFTGIR